MKFDWKFHAMAASHKGSIGIARDCQVVDGK